jgi:hypothetical protein
MKKLILAGTIVLGSLSLYSCGNNDGGAGTEDGTVIDTDTTVSEVEVDKTVIDTDTTTDTETIDVDNNNE